MRITQQIYYGASQRYVQEGLSRVFDANRDLGTGIRLHAPSDNPADFERLLSYNRSLSDLTQFVENTSRGRTFVDTSATNLENVNEIISSAREAILQAKSGVIGEDSRATLINELSGHIEDLIGLGNSKLGNRFLFAGTASDSQPFRLQQDSQGRDFVQYFGNSQNILAQIGPSTQSVLNVPGDSVFAAGSRGETVYEGLTGASAGSGADNGKALDRLEVYHGTTTITGASGLQVGTSSAASDTIIGPLASHSLSIQVDPGGATGVISLNGGIEVPFQNPNTDLRVEGPDGEVVYLDTTNIVGSFSGSVDLSADGELSIDGGVTREAIDFSANQQAKDPSKNVVLNVNTTNIRRAGDETVRYTGTFDLFSSLIAIRDELREIGVNDTSSNDNDKLNSLIDEFDESADRILSALGRLGTLSARLESSETRLEEVKVGVRSLKSDVEDTDFLEASSRLQANQNSYQAALLLASRVGELSLLNFI